MSEEGASFAVLGVDIEALGAAVTHHWGLDDGVQHMVAPLAAPTAAVAHADLDVDMLRLVASCRQRGARRRRAAAAPGASPRLQRVAQRYGRALDITLEGYPGRAAAAVDAQARIGPARVTARRRCRTTPQPRASARQR